MKTAFLYNIVKRWILLISVIFVILMNYLSNALPFGGQTNAEVSAKFPTLITPSGYAFSIWGIIYLALLIFAVFQLQKAKEIRFYTLVWPYIIIGCIANVLWLIAFQNEWLAVSVILISVLLWSFIAIFKLFYRFRLVLNTTHRYFIQVPFSLYFGWVSVATMVNVAVFLTSLNLSFLAGTEETMAVIILILGFALALFLLIGQKDYVFSISVIWAYVAIWIANTDVASVMHTAKYAAIVLIAAAIIQLVSERLKVSQYGRQAS
jgi:hypothetical protein